MALFTWGASRDVHKVCEVGEANLRTFQDGPPIDVVFANSVLPWLPDRGQSAPVPPSPGQCTDPHLPQSPVPIRPSWPPLASQVDLWETTTFHLLDSLRGLVRQHRTAPLPGTTPEPGRLQGRSAGSLPRRVLSQRRRQGAVSLPAPVLGGRREDQVLPVAAHIM